MDGIDRALGYNGYLTAALGRGLDLRADSSSESGQVDLSLSVTAPHLRADLKGVISEGSIRLVETAAIDFVPPAPGREAVFFRGISLRLHVGGDLPVKVEIDRFQTDLARFSPSGTALGVRLIGGRQHGFQFGSRRGFRNPGSDRFA